ncbi:MAG TPA: hypothetical protein VES69_10830 [Pyrinomonadaceae bacterium]|nr:hypothetical protein [Pyrinomonadaceae bacterium]
MDLALERTRLLQRDAEWAAAASEGHDLERVLSFWTDDAVVLATLPRAAQSLSGVEKPMANGAVPWISGMRSRQANAGGPARRLYNWRTWRGHRWIIGSAIWGVD